MLVKGATAVHCCKEHFIASVTELLNEISATHVIPQLHIYYHMIWLWSVFN